MTFSRHGRRCSRMLSGFLSPSRVDPGQPGAQDLSPPAPPQAAPAATHASLSSPPQPVTSEPLAGPWGRAPDPMPAVCGFCRRHVCWVQVSHRSVSFGTRGLVSRTALATRPAGRCGKHWSEGADVLALGNWFQKRNPQGGAAPGGQRSVMSPAITFPAVAPRAPVSV